MRYCVECHFDSCSGSGLDVAVAHSSGPSGAMYASLATQILQVVCFSQATVLPAYSMTEVMHGPGGALVC